MIFVESKAFAAKVFTILTEAELFSLENTLLDDPETGDLIPGGGGLRKIRVASRGKGKRGGSRVIYYWYVTPEKIQFCRIYEKSAQADVSKTELKIMREELE